jgi:hypothetical protein
MAGSFSNAQESAILANRFGATALAAAPATLYFALLTDSNTPTQRDANTVTEVSTANWTNYQRCAMTNNTTNFPAPTGTAPTTSTNAVAIGPAGFLSSGTTITGTPLQITAVAIYDAATAGNLYGWFDLAAPKTPTAGDTFSLPIGAMTATLD